MIDVPALALMVVLDAEVVGLLLLVGTLNLAALLRPGSYAPVGWRSRMAAELSSSRLASNSRSCSGQRIDEGNGDRIQRDTEEIARAAADIERQRAVEAGDEAKERDIDAQIAKLQHDRTEADAERVAAHDREVADEKVIADRDRDRDRDLREALAGGAGSNPGGPGGALVVPAATPAVLGGGPVSGPDPAPGPGGPPVVPPRRVG